MACVLMRCCMCTCRFICILHIYIAACISEVPHPSCSISCRKKGPIMGHLISDARLPFRALIMVYMCTGASSSLHSLLGCYFINSLSLTCGSPRIVHHGETEPSIIVKLSVVCRWAGYLLLRLMSFSMIFSNYLCQNLLQNQLQTTV